MGGVMALSPSGGRREVLTAAGLLRDNQHAGSSSGGGSSTLLSAFHGGITEGAVGWSASQGITDLGPPAFHSGITGGPEWPSVSLESQTPLSWCGASSNVQLRLVQSGLVTPLDLAGFCDSEDDVREAFRTSLSGVHLDEMVSAWRESRITSRVHVRRLVGTFRGPTEVASTPGTTTASTTSSS